MDFEIHAHVLREFRNLRSSANIVFSLAKGRRANGQTGKWANAVPRMCPPKCTSRYPSRAIVFSLAPRMCPLVPPECAPRMCNVPPGSYKKRMDFKEALFLHKGRMSPVSFEICANRPPFSFHCFHLYLFFPVFVDSFVYKD